MSVDDDRIRGLFSHALSDATLVRPAILLIAKIRPCAWSETATSFLKVPGDEFFTYRDIVEADLRELANNQQNAHRVVFLGDATPNDKLMLGELRWLLALAEMWERCIAQYEFGQFLARALTRSYGDTGLGSASVLHRIPLMRDANAAAAQLVDRVFGPPTRAEYFGENGNLLRPIGPPEPETLMRRLVAFAFLHRHDVEQQAGLEGESLMFMLRRLDVEAESWWDQLAADQALDSFSVQRRRLMPSRAEIQGSETPVRAWWSYLSRLDHDEDIALAVLSR